MRARDGFVTLAAIAGTLAVVPDALAHDGARGGRRARSAHGAPVPPPPPRVAGTGRLRNAARNLCLDVAGWAAEGDRDVLLWACNEDPDQVWSFAPGGELRDALTGECLDVAGHDGAKGADVGTYRCEGMDDQRWTLANRPHGRFELRSVKSGLCLDVSGRAGKRGDNVLLWACDGGADQLWTWEPYAPPQQRQAPPAPPPPLPRPTSRDDAWRRQARAMDDDDFRRLVGAVRNEGFADNKLAVIESASARNYFRVGQLKTLLGELAFSATKLRALYLIAPRLLDPENRFAVYDSFSHSADKEQAEQILRRSGCLGRWAFVGELTQRRAAAVQPGARARGQRGARSRRKTVGGLATHVLQRGVALDRVDDRRKRRLVGIGAQRKAAAPAARPATRDPPAARTGRAPAAAAGAGRAPGRRRTAARARRRPRAPPAPRAARWRRWPGARRRDPDERRAPRARARHRCGGPPRSRRR